MGGKKAGGGRFRGTYELDNSDLFVSKPKKLFKRIVCSYCRSTKEVKGGSCRGCGARTDSDVD